MGMRMKRQAHINITLFSMPTFFLFQLMTMENTTEVTVFRAMLHRNPLLK